MALQMMSSRAFLWLRRRFLHPASLTFIFLVVIVGWRIVDSGGDPLSLARLGTIFTQGDPNGTEGYDGQFVYYIARDLSPEDVRAFLDVPAYRYQRILLPLLAKLVVFGYEPALPWALATLGILAQAAGTWVVAELLAGWGVSRWYALGYGLFAGFTLSVALDLPEPLAYGLVAGAFLAMERGKKRIAWLLFGLALFAKEVTALFVVAALISVILSRRSSDVVGISLFAIVPYGLFQLWLWRVFGQPGLGSGGAMATPFEVVPFMGLWRIGIYSPPYLAAMLIVFGPAILLPTFWGLWVGIKKWLAQDREIVVIALVLNALIMLFLPFSTYRETGGLLRFACGLVLAVLMFSSRYRLWKVLNYSQFWFVLNVFLLKS